MGTGVRVDPYRSFNFRVEGVGIANFSEVSGLSSDGTAVEYREGTDGTLAVRKLAGRRSYGNVTLKKGLTPDLTLFHWYQNIINGVRDRRACMIVLQDEEGTDVMRWSLHNAYVNKYEVSTFSATANDVVVESVELVHEGFDMETA
jgi:phage tail-like protein